MLFHAFMADMLCLFKNKVQSRKAYKTNLFLLTILILTITESIKVKVITKSIADIIVKGLRLAVNFIIEIPKEVLEIETSKTVGIKKDISIYILPFSAPSLNIMGKTKDCKNIPEATEIPIINIFSPQVAEVCQKKYGIIENKPPIIKRIRPKMYFPSTISTLERGIVKA